MTEEHPVLVDSNIYIHCLRQGVDPTEHLLDRYPLTALVTCGMVKAEVLRGMKSIKFRDRLDGLFQVMRFVKTNEKLWDKAWQLAWKMDRQGRTIPLTDIVIAACAMEDGAAVLTHDRHFDLVPGLRVEAM